MDSFEDVDIHSLDHSTQDRACNKDNAFLHINGIANDTEVRGTENRRPGAMKCRVPSEEAYQQAFLPFHTDTGTPYPCKQSDLDVHNIRAFQQPNNRPFVSVMEATREIMVHNHVTRRVPPSELVAIDSLRTTVDAVEKRMDFGPDLAVKAFVDLDVLFFGGQLRNHVRVQWVRASDHASFARGRECWGVAIYLRKRGKCLIKLNADLHLLQSRDEDPLRTMFGTLLHEMCHAYEAVRCEESGINGRGHDEFFRTRIAVVHQRALRVLGLWAVGKGELYRQYHFFPGEQTATGMVVAWVMDVVLDVDERVSKKMGAVADIAAQGVTAMKRWMLTEVVEVE